MLGFHVSVHIRDVHLAFLAALNGIDGCVITSGAVIAETH